MVGMMEMASAWCECEKVAAFRAGWYEGDDEDCARRGPREVDGSRRHCTFDRRATDGRTDCLSNANASREGAFVAMLKPVSKPVQPLAAPNRVQGSLLSSRLLRRVVAAASVLCASGMCIETQSGLGGPLKLQYPEVSMRGVLCEPISCDRGSSKHGCCAEVWG
jgi:hypothetical protein